MTCPVAVPLLDEDPSVRYTELVVVEVVFAVSVSVPVPVSELAEYVGTVDVVSVAGAELVVDMEIDVEVVWLLRI